MVKQYPHTLTFTTVIGSVQNGQGDWTSGTPSESSEYSCRFEPASGNAFVPGVDGEKLYYNGTVYMGMSVPDIPTGAMVTVKKGAEVLSNSKVLRFSVGQLNKRAWL